MPYVLKCSVWSRFKLNGGASKANTIIFAEYFFRFNLKILIYNKSAESCYLLAALILTLAVAFNINIFHASVAQLGRVCAFLGATLPTRVPIPGCHSEIFVSRGCRKVPLLP